MRPTWLLALVLAGTAACAGSSRPERAVSHQADPATDDDRLVARVRKAAAAAGGPDALVAAVGAPLVDSRRGPSMEVLRAVDFVADPDHGDEPLVLTGVEALIYWERPVASHDPRVVGVAYRADGTATVFFAMILPP